MGVKDPLAAELKKLGERMVVMNAELRPTARDVVAQLDSELTFEPLLEQLKGRVDDIIADAPQELWEELFRSQTASWFDRSRVSPVGPSACDGTGFSPQQPLRSARCKRGQDPPSSGLLRARPVMLTCRSVAFEVLLRMSGP